VRRDGKKCNDQEYLGKVLDKEKGIFWSKARGEFRFSPEDGYSDVQGGAAHAKRIGNLILDFGNAFALHEALKKSGYLDLFAGTLPKEKDTLLSLLFHRVLGDGIAYYAEDWWEGSYARLLFPDAKLKSQRVSEFLAKLGDEAVQRKFFGNYLPFACNGGLKEGIIIDGTAMPNDIQFPLSAVHTERGMTDTETRLVYVVNRATGMPLFFRYCAGNIVDVSTLETTIRFLKKYGVETEFAIVDAGYCSASNITALFAAKINFLTRLAAGRKMYNNLIKEYAAGLENVRNLVTYRGRTLFIKKVETTLYGYAGFAYIASDVARRADELNKYLPGAVEDGKSEKELQAKMDSAGMFILISSKSIAKEDILPFYYSRQMIEQVFDVSKNNIGLLPIRSHKEETFRGQLMMSFMAAIAFTCLQQQLGGSPFHADGAMTILKNLKCSVFDDGILISEPQKKAKDIAELLGISIPSEL
jgi:hypothetical protein